MEQGQRENKRSYNRVLFDRRLELGLRRHKFAKSIGMGYFRYYLIECGYVRPRPKDIEIFSKALGEDFNQYMGGIAGCPEELPDKESTRLSKWFFRLLGKKWMRFTLTIVTSLFLVAFVVGQSVSAYDINHEENFYNETCVVLHRKIVDKGDYNFQFIGDPTFPQISTKTTDSLGNEKFIQIRTNGEDSEFSFEFSEIYWNDDYRFYFAEDETEEGASAYTVQILTYSDGKFYDGFIVQTDDLVLPFVDEDTIPEAAVEAMVEVFEANSFEEDFKNLISSEFSMTVDFRNDILIPYHLSYSRLSAREMIFGVILGIVCLIVGALSLFGTIFAFVYGSSPEDGIKSFNHSDALLGFRRSAEPKKKDLKFSPFLPETLMELIGIGLVALGSLRVILLSMNVITYSSEATTRAATFFSVQLMGMFLLYFIDFDLFLDDKRMIRNIASYSIVFLVLYFLEVTLITNFNSAGIIAQLGSSLFLVPNPFGSVACYYSLMMFLFFTPKFIKSKKGLITFRCLGILPIMYLVASFLIYHADVIFGYEFESLWFRYFFTSERLPFTMLAVLYLVGYFFMRLHYKRLYGEENAKKYFMSNRFIMTKNIMTATLVVLVWIFEMIFSTNGTMNKIGIGLSKYLIVLAPLLLFYHPHKGPRNLAVDGMTMTLYFVSLAYGYVIAFFNVVVGLMG